jgi:hypothetical protein
MVSGVRSMSAEPTEPSSPYDPDAPLPVVRHQFFLQGMHELAPRMLRRPPFVADDFQRFSQSDARMRIAIGQRGAPPVHPQSPVSSMIHGMTRGFGIEHFKAGYCRIQRVRLSGGKHAIQAGHPCGQRPMASRLVTVPSHPSRPVPVLDAPRDLIRSEKHGRPQHPLNRVAMSSSTPRSKEIVLPTGS